MLLLRRFTGADAQDAVKLFFVGLSAGEVVKRFCGLLDQVTGDKWCAFGGALFGIFQAAFPFEHGPAFESVLGELAENTAKVDLAVAERTEATGTVFPALVTAVGADATIGTELSVFDVKALNARMVVIDVGAVIHAL